MTARIWVDAVLGFLITFGTSVTALLAQEGVKNLSDISQAAWWAVFAGAVVATAKTVQSRMGLTPEQERQVTAERRRQGGFAHARLLQVVAMTGALMFAVLLAGCAAPETPRQAVAGYYIAIEAVAESADIAHRNGHLDPEIREKLRADLQEALDLMREAEPLIVAGDSAEGRLERVSELLVIVRDTIEREVSRDE